MSREQFLAVGNGLIGLGCSVIEVAILGPLFTSLFPGERPPTTWRDLAAMVAVGLVCMGLLCFIGYVMIGAMSETTVTD